MTSSLPTELLWTLCQDGALPCSPNMVSAHGHISPMRQAPDQQNVSVHSCQGTLTSPLFACALAFVHCVPSVGVPAAQSHRSVQTMQPCYCGTGNRYGGGASPHQINSDKESLTPGAAGRGDSLDLRMASTWSKLCSVGSHMRQSPDC